jgi:DNA-binding IclR family transcriptional regulator
VTEPRDTRDAVYAEIDLIATWTKWLPFSEGARTIDRLPGVYSMRSGDRIVYVGMAGERAGRGSSKPAGMRGRLARYTSGKAAASGFGEAALDRALADVDFVRQQLTALEQSEPRRTTEWAKDAIEWHRVELRWTVCTDADAARDLEEHIVLLLRPHGIWNR